MDFMCFCKGQISNKSPGTDFYGTYFLLLVSMILGRCYSLDSGIAKGFKQDSYLVALCEVIGRLIEVSTKRLLSDLIQRRSIWIAQISHMAFCTTKLFVKYYTSCWKISVKSSFWRPYSMWQKIRFFKLSKEVSIQWILSILSFWNDI